MESTFDSFSVGSMLVPGVPRADIGLHSVQSVATCAWNDGARGEGILARRLSRWRSVVQ
jgi:hypothetical protein